MNGIKTSFSKIDNNVVKTLLNEKWQNSNYSERIWGNTDALASQVNEIIGGALMCGQGIEKTARQIRERFDVGEYYSRRLARTEMAHFNNQADAMAYEEMGTKEYVCVATLDGRTSPYCIDIDGKHFKYSEMKEGENYPPFHPNCRCTTRGYLGKEIEKTLKGRARNPITVETEIVPNMTYNEWQKSNGLDIQRIVNKKKKIDKSNRKSKDNEAIDSSMKKFNLNSDIITYRGTQKKYYNNYNVGDTINEKIYYSTSLDKSTAEDIAERFKDIDINGNLIDNSMLLEIRVPKNTKSLYVGKNSDYLNEKELLLSRDLSYKIISKSQNKMVLEVIKDEISRKNE